MMRKSTPSGLGRGRALACLALLAGVLPEVAGAGVALGAHDVGNVIMKETRNVIVGIGAHGNPDGCTKGSEVMITTHHPGQQQMLTTLLAAKATRSQVDFSVDGCFSAYGHTYPVVIELTWD